MKLTAFILVGIGTIGLLFNEFLFDWGTVATIIFAACNLIGLITLVVSHWVIRDY
jgi:hypothetical protein